MTTATVSPEVAVEFAAGQSSPTVAADAATTAEVISKVNTRVLRTPGPGAASATVDELLKSDVLLTETFHVPARSVPAGAVVAATPKPVLAPDAMATPGFEATKVH